MRLAKSIVGEAEAAAVAAVICEDGYLGMGKTVQAFEAEVANFLGVPAASVVSVNSGTAALHLAVQAVVNSYKAGHNLEHQPGQNLAGDNPVKPNAGHRTTIPTTKDFEACQPEVLVPSLTFVASFQAILAAGAKPVACEVLAQTATLDLADAAKRITPQTVAIMPVHYGSNPYHLAEVYAFAKAHNLRVIEDAAHAFGCSYQNNKIGSKGDIICFSFDGIKNITCGEGGCIVCQDEQVLSLCQDARLLGVENDTAKRYAGSRSWDFEVHHQGYRYHMSNIMAAIGRVQLSRFATEFAPKRKFLVQQYQQLFKDTPGIELLHMDAEADIVAHLFALKILNGKKEQVLAACATADIPLGQHYKPNHLLSLFANGQNLPVTEALFNELVSLPLHPELELTDLQRVHEIITKAVHYA